MYKNLVLSGGSVRGLAHVGAIQKLIDLNMIDLKKIEAVAGASAGAIIGCLIVLGFSPTEIWDFILNLNMTKLVNPDLVMFMTKCGIERGTILYNLLEQILTVKTKNKHITFKELHDLTKIHFTVVGSCLTTKEEIYYDHINTPNFKVSMAIRISIGMPGFFTPIEVDGKKYVDGAVLNNFPMNLFKDRIADTIGILICGEYDTNYTFPEEYFIAIINLFMYKYYQETCAKFESNTIYVKKNLPNISIFDFEIDKQIKEQLYNCGTSAVEDFYNKNKK